MKDIWTEGASHNVWEAGTYQRKARKPCKPKEIFIGHATTRQALKERYRITVESNRDPDEKDWQHPNVNSIKQNRRERQTVELFNLCQRHKLDFRLGEDGKKHQGFALVDNKFVVSLGGGKWRVLDKWKWYRYRDMQSFIHRFVLKDK